MPSLILGLALAIMSLKYPVKLIVHCVKEHLKYFIISLVPNGPASCDKNFHEEVPFIFVLFGALILFYLFKALGKVFLFGNLHICRRFNNVCC